MWGDAGKILLMLFLDATLYATVFVVVGVMSVETSYSAFLLMSPPATLNLFPVFIVLHFEECCIVGII